MADLPTVMEQAVKCCVCIVFLLPQDLLVLEEQEVRFYVLVCYKLPHCSTFAFKRHLFYFTFSHFNMRDLFEGVSVWSGSFNVWPLNITQEPKHTIRVLHLRSANTWECGGGCDWPH